MVNEFETKRGIERSPAPVKGTGLYGDNGISLELKKQTRGKHKVGCLQTPAWPEQPVEGNGIS